jgi:hypothetical protein
MSCDIAAAAAPRRIWRVGRTPDAWAWPDWRFAGPDGTFGHRFDDPRGEYRVLYASSERFGAFVEALAPYRPHPALLEARRRLVDSGAAEGLAPGTLPAGWVGSRTIGEAQPRPRSPTSATPARCGCCATGSGRTRWGGASTSSTPPRSG